MKIKTAKQAEKLTAPGRHSVGDNLYLSISGVGAKSWVFMFRWQGKQRELGLGSASTVSLADARAAAAQHRASLAKGKEPVGKRAAAAKTASDGTTTTFGAYADELIEMLRPSWRSDVHARQWEQSLRDHAAPLRDIPVASISTEDVLGVLKPIWNERRQTADRVRNRIERVWSYAKTKDVENNPQRWEGKLNPARWRDHLKNLLAPRPKIEKPHHPAMPYTALGSFMEKLRERRGVTAKALEFCILTAARTDEVLGMTWSEVNLNETLWSVPGKRMKAGFTHVVPLPSRCVEILSEMRSHPAFDASGYVFPGRRRNRPLSPNVLLQFVKQKMGEATCSVHGFRSTFRDWAGDCTPVPREVAEHALAHGISDKAEAAYRRADALLKRRSLMESWSAFCGTAPSTSNVVQLRAG
jgi:integrase